MSITHCCPSANAQSEAAKRWTTTRPDPPVEELLGHAIMPGSLTGFLKLAQKRNNEISCNSHAAATRVPDTGTAAPSAVAPCEPAVTDEVLVPPATMRTRAHGRLAPEHAWRRNGPHNESCHLPHPRGNRAALV